MARTWRVTLGALVAVVAVAVGLVWAGQGRLVYHPDTRAVPAVADVLPGAREVHLTTSDGLRLGAWYLPPADGCDAAVLVTPGNGGHRAGRAGLARALHAQGFGVLLLDYRGYGGNEGTPSQAGLARDARAAREHLVGEAGIRQDRLVYLGESLGAAVATALAVEHPPAALVLRSPFTSLADAGRAAVHVPVGWLLRDRYDVRALVARVDAPVAVVHGTADTIVPPSQSREVADAVRGTGAQVVERKVAGAGHNDADLAHGAVLVDAVAEVARAAGAGCDGSPDGR
ncbi:alpha/beta hydrolase [Cellulomonas phragmiteti]|uniref:Serine aminopeptidase S33 domain-containing protein n=1 Tax=Cellulomonas phragmiteti TaxID=478780 RepID=A0ABQ4DHD0_9CELL|nr:alpha/beta fold hydrolase [Cellulomonas phragmiteti]GIG38729.1 hypothetical protein Cph01nite_04910 [Cellulomonas phragmiteti]